MATSRAVVALAVSALAGACLIALPTASVAADRSGADGAAEVASDALIPEPGTRPLRTIPATRLSGAGAVYDLHVYVLVTPTRPLVVSQTQMQTYIQRVNEFYAEQLGAVAPSFRFTSFSAVPTQQESTCGVEPAEAVVGADALRALKPTAGALDATWLIVSPDVLSSVTCDYGGQAWLSSRGAWARHQARAVASGWFYLTLVHEFGHNFGLTHASKVYTREGVRGWQGDGLDEFEPYEDQADPMGAAPYVRNAASGTWNFPTVNLQGHHRNVLGGMPASAIASVARGATTTISLSTLTASSGTRLIYLPLFNRAKFVLEYRSATGNDAPLTGRYAPGAGVYLRMVNTGHDQGPAGYDPGAGPRATASTGTVSWTAEEWPKGSTAYSVRQGHVAGNSMTLPDGTTITVGAVSPSTAQVTISRPADTEPPSFTTSAYLDGCYSALNGTPCALRARETAPGVATADLTLPRVTDNQWVSSFTVAVNGAVVLRRTSPPPGIIGERDGLAEGSAAEVVPLSLAAGASVVTLTVTDLAGQTYSESTTVSVTPLRPATAPRDLWHEILGVDDLAIYWTAPADTRGLPITRYLVERSVNGGEWSDEVSIHPQYGGVRMSYQPLNVPLRYRVAAETEAGKGDWDTTSEIILVSVSVPSPPQQVTLIRGDGAITVRWRPPANNGGSALHGYEATASSGDVCRATGAETECVISGLQNGSPYTVRVVASNASGTSDPSDIAGPVTPAGRPSPPTTVSAVAGDKSVTVTWDEPVDDGGSAITGYTVSSSGTTVCQTTSTTCQVANLLNGTSYIFHVLATNGVANSELSVAATATPAGLPGKVTNVRGTLSGRTIRLTWSPPTDTGGAPVSQYRYRLGTGAWLTTTGTSASIPLPRGGTSVTLSIQAANRVGWGPAYTQRFRTI